MVGIVDIHAHLTSADGNGRVLVHINRNNFTGRPYDLGFDVFGGAIADVVSQRKGFAGTPALFRKDFGIAFVQGYRGRLQVSMVVPRKYSVRIPGTCGLLQQKKRW